LEKQTKKQARDFNVFLIKCVLVGIPPASIIYNGVAKNITTGGRVELFQLLKAHLD
jgi:hypothetical protein